MICPQAYQEALNCLEYMRLNPENRIVFYEDIAREQVTVNNFLRRGGRNSDPLDSAGRSERRLRVHGGAVPPFCPDCGNAKPMAFQYYIHDVINTLMKNFQAYISEETQTSINVLHLLSVSKSLNTASIQHELNNLIQSLCGRIEREMRLNAESGSKKSSLAYKIRDYIDQNYTDPSICTESIAQEFGITSTYVSKLFRSISDKRGFVNYISTKRIERAKQLLIETDLKTDEIMSQTGFLNASSFIRLFKSHEGITPGTTGNCTKNKLIGRRVYHITVQIAIKKKTGQRRRPHENCFLSFLMRSQTKIHNGFLLPAFICRFPAVFYFSSIALNSGFSAKCLSITSGSVAE